MQSQQKRVKWSRGETAEALEERTDTGITQASVEYMQDCIPDIYGNISRRPGIKLLPFANNYWTGTATDYGFQYDEYLQVFPFYITEHDYVLVGVHFTGITELIRIKDGVAVWYKTAKTENNAFPKTGVELGLISGVYSYRPVSYAQQNNYMLIADGYNVYKLQIITSLVDDSFTPTLELWKFNAGWYAPQGTQTHQANNITLTGLAISGHFYNYVYTENDGSTTVYSNTDTGIDGQGNIATIKAQIPVGSIVHLPNIGCYFRVEGYYTEDDNLYFSNITFDRVRNNTPTGTGVECVTYVGQNACGISHYSNGVLVTSIAIPQGEVITVKCSASQTGYSKNSWTLNGLSMVWGTWTDADQTDSSVRMYGALLTPVADENATDSVISVETGYTSLTPTTWDETGSFPHPKKLAFNNQRLWASGWSYSSKEEYPLTIGSQIARYSDFKNDYNQENEPITLDILTQFKERVIHLIDYNGLKIMTDVYEYAYDNDGVAKQSANGSFEYCDPIIFDSLCLYVDSTGCQVKAMQYELQSNIFNSSTINQLTPHDLVWYPWAMASYEDKTNNTGKYLFLVNRNDANARLAVCNFVPSNQANIWNRWTFPMVNLIGYTDKQVSLLHSIVNTKSEPIFLLVFNEFSGGVPGTATANVIVPAVIDFNVNTDANSDVYTKTQANYFAPLYTEQPFFRITLPNTQVAVYSDNEFKFITTTTSTGAITDDISSLTNVTIGFPINSVIRSHPIDVGGKTKSIKKRIGKAQMSVHNTEPGAITINGKTGYMNPAKDHITFYGVTGMKNEIKYTITNKQGAMFHLESLLMNIEYGTLIS